MQWSEVEGAVSYRVTSAVNGMVQQPHISDATETTATWIVSDGDQVRWAVQAIGALGETSPASVDWGLVADAAVTPTPTPTGGVTLPAPSLLFPPDDFPVGLEYGKTLKIPFQWSAVPGADHYRLQIEEAGEVLQSHDTAENTFDITFVFDRDYSLTWSVFGLDENGTLGEESARRTLSFTAGPAPTPTETPVPTETPEPVAADLNRDTHVDGLDLFHLAHLYGSEEMAVNSTLDLDENGTVDGADLLRFIQEYRAER